MPTEPNPGNARIIDSTNAQAAQLFLANFPSYPAEVKARFPSMQAHEDAMKDWLKQAVFNIRGAL